MRRIFCWLILLCLALPLSALNQKFLTPFSPVTPEVLAEGKAFTGVAEGYNALFTNPAGFSSSKPCMTFLSVQGGALMPLSIMNKVIPNIDAFKNFDITKASDSLNLVSDIVTNSGVGAQASAGIGWVGNGFGIGLATDQRVYAKGNTILGTTATVDSTTGLVAGYALPVDLQWAKLHLGIDIRPMEKIYSDKIELVDLLGSSATNIKNLDFYHGYGVAWDLGSLMDFGLTPTGYWKAGLTLRDVGSTTFTFYERTLNEILSEKLIPTKSSSTPSADYRIPMTINFGGSWRPDMGLWKNVIDPMVQMDFQIPLMDEYTQTSFYTWTHIGAEAKFLQFLSVRAGLNQGYLTFGVGMKALFLELNAAIYSEELGRYVGIQKRSGAVIETAIRW